MIVINKKILDDFCRKHSDAKKPIGALVNELNHATWLSPSDIKLKYPKASIIDKTNVVFDVRNNNYRIWVLVRYQEGVILIKKVGTHKDYDNWRIKP